MTTDVTSLSAAELALRIRRGDLSPVECVDAFLARIDQRNDRINAFVHVCDDRAREAAREAERAVEAGDDLGPLHGVPVAIKDLTHVAGVPTTFGSKPFADFVPDEDAVVVSRLREAGAIVLGKTNTPEFGRLTNTRNLLYGATGNPWDPSKTAGGSSGGSAAAVADGLVPLAQGTDAAGSIRIPSAACGVYGLMPDFGRIPLGNARPDAFVNTHPYTFTGPIARSVGDAALMMDAVAGPHPADPFSLPEPGSVYAGAARGSIDGLRVAYSPDLGICRATEPVRDRMEEAVDGLRTAGATVERADPPFADDAETVHGALSTLLQERYRGMHDTFARDLGIDLLERRDEVTEEVVSRVERSKSLSALDVRRAERVRTAAYDAVQNLLADYDLLVTPTLAIPPFDVDDEPTEIDGEPVDPNHGWILTWPFNLTGNPTASVPAGFVDGLPVGMQLVGRRLDDATVVAASAAYERANPWADAYPPRR